MADVKDKKNQAATPSAEDIKAKIATSDSLFYRLWTKPKVKDRAKDQEFTLEIRIPKWANLIATDKAKDEKRDGNKYEIQYVRELMSEEGSKTDFRPLFKATHQLIICIR